MNSEATDVKYTETTNTINHKNVKKKKWVAQASKHHKILHKHSLKSFGWLHWLLRSFSCFSKIPAMLLFTFINSLFHKRFKSVPTTEITDQTWHAKYRLHMNRICGQQLQRKTSKYYFQSGVSFFVAVITIFFLVILDSSRHDFEQICHCKVTKST